MLHELSKDVSLFIQNKNRGSFIRASCRDCWGLSPALGHCFLAGLCIWVEVVVEGIVLADRIVEGTVVAGDRGKVAVRIEAGHIVAEGTEGEEGVVVADVLG